MPKKYTKVTEMRGQIAGAIKEPVIEKIPNKAKSAELHLRRVRKLKSSQTGFPPYRFVKSRLQIKAAERGIKLGPKKAGQLLRQSVNRSFEAVPRPLEQIVPTKPLLKPRKNVSGKKPLPSSVQRAAFENVKFRKFAANSNTRVSPTSINPTTIPGFSKLSKVARRFGKSALVLGVLEGMRTK